MNYLIPEEIKNQILELKKTMERIKLDGLILNIIKIHTEM